MNSLGPANRARSSFVGSDCNPKTLNMCMEAFPHFGPLNLQTAAAARMSEKFEVHPFRHTISVEIRDPGAFR